MDLIISVITTRNFWSPAWMVNAQGGGTEKIVIKSLNMETALIAQRKVRCSSEAHCCSDTQGHSSEFPLTSLLIGSERSLLLSPEG